MKEMARMKKMYTLICTTAMLVFFSCAGSGETVKNPGRMIANIAPFSIGSATTQLEKIFTAKLTDAEIDVVFHPRQNEVALVFRHEMLTYRLFWGQEARQSFIDALNRYHEDFTNKKLITKNNKTRAAYGKQTIKLEWESFSFSKTYKASPKIELGYRFKKNAVYFTSYQNTAKTDSVSDKTNDSPAFTMYFNRAQADTLAKLFDQAYLVGLVGDSASAEKSVPLNTKIDTYNEK